MNLRKGDGVTFLDANGAELRGVAVYYNPSEAIIGLRVLGKPFIWEGGPPVGDVGYSDSFWSVPVKDVTAITPRGTVTEPIRRRLA